MPRIRNAIHLRDHLSAFEAGDPIQKGYIARLFIMDGLSVHEVSRQVRNLVHAREPDKLVHVGSLNTRLYSFRKLIVTSKRCLTTSWPSLIKLFLQPLTISFKSPPVAPVSSQPVQTSDPSTSRHPEPATSPSSEMPSQPDIPVTSTLMQPMQNSTTVNAQCMQKKNLPSFPTTCELPLPRKVKKDCANCVTKQQNYMKMLQKNKSLRHKLKEFKMQFIEENGNLSMKKVNEKIKSKDQQISKWKVKYTSLKEACKNPHKLLKCVESLEQQVKILEVKLTAAQEENINMASVNECLKRRLERSENANVNFKRMHEQLTSLLEAADNDDEHLKWYRQRSHSPEMEIQEISPWEAADNHGGNVALQDDEIKQEPIYEEHPERSWWRETSDSDETTISQNIASNVSVKDRLCDERCQMKADGGCLDHASSIYIDNAEMTCENISTEDENETVTAEEKVEQPDLFSENEDAGSHTKLCYANSHADHKDNCTHQSTHRT